jgi:hypothetical protein
LLGQQCSLIDRKSKLTVASAAFFVVYDFHGGLCKLVPDPEIANLPTCSIQNSDSRSNCG